LRAASFVQRALSLGLALAIALPPSAIALADDTTKVALAPIVPLFPGPGGVPQATADKLTEMLARELRKQDGLTPNPDSTSDDDDDDKGGGDSGGDAAGPFTGAGERALIKGQAQIAKGKKEMQRLKFDAAVTDFQDGIAGIEGSFAVLTDYGVLVDGYLQLAIAELRGAQPRGQLPGGVHAALRQPQAQAEPGTEGHAGRDLDASGPDGAPRRSRFGCDAGFAGPDCGHALRGDRRRQRQGRL
jgi:hypothetical protein